MLTTLVKKRVGDFEKKVENNYIAVDKFVDKLLKGVDL